MDEHIHATGHESSGSVVLLQEPYTKRAIPSKEGNRFVSPSGALVPIDELKMGSKDEVPGYIFPGKDGGFVPESEVIGIDTREYYYGADNHLYKGNLLKPVEKNGVKGWEFPGNGGFVSHKDLRRFVSTHHGGPMVKETNPDYEYPEVV